MATTDPPPTWLTLAQAKAQLRLDTPDGDPGDAFLLFEMSAAESAVVAYLNKSLRGRANVDAWATDPTTLPPDVRAVMLYKLGELDGYRGDSTQQDGPQRTVDRDFPDAVIGQLRRYTDPIAK